MKPRYATFIGDRAADLLNTTTEDPAIAGRQVRIDRAIYDPNTKLTRVRMTPVEITDNDWTAEPRGGGSDAPSRSEWTSANTWRDPDCIECGGEGAPCCDPPDHPAPQTEVLP